MSATPDADRIAVRLLRFPLDVYRRSNEHFEGLKREFALMSMGDTTSVPGRLLNLVDALGRDYAQPMAAADLVRQAAMERGEVELDELRYDVPRSAVDATFALSAMLDEADDFCRRGEHLLSLDPPPESLAFRRWYFGEFVAQARGLHPLPWPEVDQAALAASSTLRGAGSD